MNNTNPHGSLFRSSRVLSIALLCAVLPACIQDNAPADVVLDGPDKDPVVETQAPPTAEAFAAMSLDARDAYTQVFDVNVDDWTHLQGEQGSELFFHPNSFVDGDGNFATGEVQVELIEIFDKGAMLVTDMPSNGLRANGDVALLVSGGEHFVGATQDGEELRLHGQFQLTAPADITGGPDQDMRLFRADGDGDAWVEEEEDKNFRVAGEGADTAYWALSGEFGWTNIDRWYSDPRPKTTIHIDVPDGWDDTNSVVYLSYDGESNALARMDTYDDSTGLFSEHYGLIPIGLEVHIIFVTELDGQWSYTIQGTTITEDHVTVFDSAEDLIETDTDGFVQAINALP